MKNNEQEFLVWHDTLLEEYFAVPKSEASVELIEELKREKITTHSVHAEYGKEALNLIFPDRLPEPEDQVFVSRPPAMRLH